MAVGAVRSGARQKSTVGESSSGMAGRVQTPLSLKQLSSFSGMAVFFFGIYYLRYLRYKIKSTFGRLELLRARSCRRALNHARHGPAPDHLIVCFDGKCACQSPKYVH